MVAAIWRSEIAIRINLANREQHFVSAEQRELLERWARARTTPQGLVMRVQIVLLLADGLSGRAVADSLGISRHTVDLWRRRYRDGGSESLVRDRPGRGRRKKPWPSQL